MKFFELPIFEKKILYLILFLPVSILIGTLVSNFLILIIVLFFIFDLYKDKNFIYLKNKDFLILFIIWIYLILNAFFISQNEDSIIRAVGFIRFVLLAFAICYYLSLNQKKYLFTVVKFWAIIFLIITCDILFEFFFGFNTIGLSSDYPGRLASFSGDELKIGGFYFGFLFLTLAFFYKTEKKLFYIFLLIFLTISFLIGERANFVKVLFGISIFYFFLIDISLKKKFLFVGLFLLFFSVLFSSQKEFKNRYFKQIFFGTEKTGINHIYNSNRHILHYRTAVKMFKENPFFGVGIKNFRNQSLKKDYFVINSFSSSSTHPHQIHFEFLSEIGLFGYGLIMSYLIFCIIRGINLFRKYNDIFIFSSSIFMLVSILPIIPSGSFFTSFTATIFWINFSFAIQRINE
tara:strand:- start:1915 stop:3126 length:1212 start_codon:yes stop_codon:yes gene_type:complete